MGIPVVSVITVCRNAAATIEQTIQSVVGQKNASLEYLIIDGASTDGTLDIVERYRDRIDLLVSEPDGGMYEAMNKAIRLSSGRYLNFLNADDRYASPDALAGLAPALEEGFDIVYGNLIYMDGDDKKDFIPPDRLSRKYLRYSCVTQQAIFYKRDVFDKIGFFDESYKIVADYQWLIRAYKSKALEFTHIGLPVAYFGIGGVTTGSATRARYKAERARARDEQFRKVEYLFDRAVRKARHILSRFKR